MNTHSPNSTGMSPIGSFIAGLEKDLEQRFSGLRHLLENTDRIDPRVLLDETFRMLFERLRQVMPCDGLQLVLLGQDRGKIELRAELISPEDASASRRAPDEQLIEDCSLSLLWDYVSAGQLQQIHDLHVTASSLRSSVFIGRLASAGMSTGLVMPLVSAGQPIGVLISGARPTSGEPDVIVQDLGLRLSELSGLFAKAQLYELVIQSQLDSERLLRNVLPEPIVKRLKAGEQVIADGIPEATVVFVDIVDFVQLSSTMSPAAVIIVLNRIFSAFDALCEQYGVEKIKTIGDAYMLATGVPRPFVEHVRVAARIALDIRELSKRLGTREERSLSFRIGIHTGPVVAGIIGTRKFSYDLWGDTVNIASRMETLASPGSIHVTQAVYEKLQADFHFEPRGEVDVKGIGRMRTYFLMGPKASSTYRSMVWSMLSPNPMPSDEHNRRVEDDRPSAGTSPASAP